LIEIYKKDKHQTAYCFYGGLGMLTLIGRYNIAGCLLYREKNGEAALQVINRSYAD